MEMEESQIYSKRHHNSIFANISSTMPVKKHPILYNQQVGANRKDATQFYQEVHKIQMNRQKLTRKCQRAIMQQRLNIQKYLYKKSIIPESLKTSYANFQPLKIKCLLKKTNNSKFDIEKQNKNIKQSNKDKDQEVQTNAKMIQLSPANSSKQSINATSEKWRLGFSPKDINCLVFGKELKMGKKIRQKYLSDQKVLQLKKPNIIKHKTSTSTSTSAHQSIIYPQFNNIKGTILIYKKKQMKINKKQNYTIQQSHSSQLDNESVQKYSTSNLVKHYTIEHA